jgi:tRNA 2-thiouridine synthesizing protein A
MTTVVTGSVRSAAGAEIALTLDLRDLKCPLPVLRTRRALDTIPAGGVVRVFATDPAAEIDFPAFCAMAGHELVAANAVAETLEFLIRKGSGPADGAALAEE